MVQNEVSGNAFAARNQNEIKVLNKSGKLVRFNAMKIERAAWAALLSCGYDRERADELAKSVTAIVTEKVANFSKSNTVITYESIHHMVEDALMDVDKDAARSYIEYRNDRKQGKELMSDLFEQVESIIKETDKSNANTLLSPPSKMAQISETINKLYALEKVLPADIAQAHKDGKIYIHDLGWYKITYNCLNFAVHKVLNNMKMPHGYLRRPNHVGTAFALAAIALQSASNSQYGGISINSFPREMAEYVTDDTTYDEIYQACEGLIGNLNTLHARHAGQIPFTSLSIGMETNEKERMICKALLEAYDAGLGHGETALFPNLIYKVKEGVNKNPGDPNYDLFQLALRVAARRMNPTFVNLNASYNEKYGDEVSIMGCRTRVASNINGREEANGRGNIAFVTINLPYIALEAKGNKTEFFRLLKERLEMCERQLLHRYNIVKELRRKDVPFNMTNGLWMNSDDRPEDETIEESLKNGTLAFGYIGIYETLMALTGKGQHESEESQKLGLEIAKYMADYAASCVERNHLNFAVIATPAESACHTLLKATRRTFGSVPGVTDKDYFVNSCHVAPFARVTAEEKISLEAPYHKYALGGNILYIELGASPLGNIESIEHLFKFACEQDANYIAFNFPTDFCNDCGFLGIIPLDGCPVCKGKDVRRVRRITGYFSKVENFNDGKLAELHDRTTHMGIPIGVEELVDK